MTIAIQLSADEQAEVVDNIDGQAVVCLEAARRVEEGWIP